MCIATTFFAISITKPGLCLNHEFMVLTVASDCIKFELFFVQNYRVLLVLFCGLYFVVSCWRLSRKIIQRFFFACAMCSVQFCYTKFALLLVFAMVIN